jgi:hypothetical protein
MYEAVNEDHAVACDAACRTRTEETRIDDDFLTSFDYLIRRKNVAIRMSQPVFDRMISDQIDRSFLRTWITVSDVERVFDNGIHVSEIMTIPGHSYYEDHPFVVVSSSRGAAGQRYETPSNLRGSIWNYSRVVERGDHLADSVDFATDDVGFFAAIVEVEESDTLIFWGQSLSESDISLAPPTTIELNNGFVRVAGRAVLNREWSESLSLSLRVDFDYTFDIELGVRNGGITVNVTRYAISSGALYALQLLRLIAPLFLGHWTQIIEVYLLE